MKLGNGKLGNGEMGNAERCHSVACKAFDSSTNHALALAFHSSFCILHLLFPFIHHSAFFIFPPPSLQKWKRFNPM